jgi:hypothetical protein
MSIAKPVTPELVAVTLVVPSATAVTTPLPLTVATLACDSDHVAVAVISLLDPSLNCPLAVNGWDVPGAIVLLAGVMVMDRSEGSEGDELPLPPHAVATTRAAQRQVRSKKKVQWPIGTPQECSWPRSITLGPDRNKQQLSPWDSTRRQIPPCSSRRFP